MSQFKKAFVTFSVMLMAVALSGCDKCDETKNAKNTIIQMRDLLTQMAQDRSVARIGYANQLSGLNAQLEQSIEKFKKAINDHQFDHNGDLWRVEHNMETLQLKVKDITDWATGGLGAHSVEITSVSLESVNLINQQITPPGTVILHEACGDDSGAFALLEGHGDLDPRDPRSSDGSARPSLNDGNGDGSGSATATSGEATI